MKNKQAFTLIELLVVVLIIGILAAVALPQYQKAVLKTRVTEVKMAVNSLTKAREMLKLQGVEFDGQPLTGADRVGDIDVGGDCKSDGYCYLSNWRVLAFYIPECATVFEPLTSGIGGGVLYSTKVLGGEDEEQLVFYDPITGEKKDCEFMLAMNDYYPVYRQLADYCSGEHAVTIPNVWEP